MGKIFDIVMPILEIDR